MRTDVTYTFLELHSSPESFKKKALAYYDTVSYLTLLDSNTKPDRHGKFYSLLAVNAISVYRPAAVDSFSGLRAFHRQASDYLFGYLSYDLKNELEDLNSSNTDYLGFQAMEFLFLNLFLKLVLQL